MREKDVERVAEWVEERTEPAPDHWHEQAVLYADYVNWAKGLRQWVLSSKAFSLALQTIPQLAKRCHSRTRRSGFVGVRLRG